MSFSVLYTEILHLLKPVSIEKYFFTKSKLLIGFSLKLSISCLNIWASYFSLVQSRIFFLYFPEILKVLLNAFISKFDEYSWSKNCSIHPLRFTKKAYSMFFQYLSCFHRFMLAKKTVKPSMWIIAFLRKSLKLSKYQSLIVQLLTKLPTWLLKLKRFPKHSTAWNVR